MIVEKIIGGCPSGVEHVNSLSQEKAAERGILLNKSRL